MPKRTRRGPGIAARATTSGVGECLWALEAEARDAGLTLTAHLIGVAALAADEEEARGRTAAERTLN